MSSSSPSQLDARLLLLQKEGPRNTELPVNRRRNENKSTALIGIEDVATL